VGGARCRAVDGWHSHLMGAFTSAILPVMIVGSCGLAGHPYQREFLRTREND
jgi:hypothetical protein